MSRKPGSPTLDVLTRIWQRALHRSSIGVNENYFDLGGTAAAADILFAEIAKVYGRELPSTSIYHAPTIATLATLLEQPELPRFSPFIQIKAGTAYPPIIIAHGTEGRPQFSELAAQIETAHPIYGIQAKGMDGLEEPLSRIEDMADYYLGSIRKLQGHGPYVLIGYSFGGLVALEMAQNLSEVGEKVALLVLVDAYPYPSFMPAGQRLRLFAQRTRYRISEATRRPAADAIQYLVRGLKRRLHIGSDNSDLPSGSRLSFEHATRQVKKNAYLALARYRPRFYGGKMKFVKGGHDTYFPSDPAAVWAPLVSDFEFETVPGGHLDMVTGDISGLAAALSRYLSQALDSNEADLNETLDR